jgi:hypothetical protein
MGLVELTFDQKRPIVKYHAENSLGGNKMTNVALADWASNKFGQRVSIMTISRLLKRKEEYGSSGCKHSGIKRVKKLVCPEVEAATWAWFSLMQECGVTITHDLICAAAQRFYGRLPKDPSTKCLTFSHGWVRGFKKRNNIKAYARYGESTAADTSEEAHTHFQEIVALAHTYLPLEVFNMDET